MRQCCDGVTDLYIAAVMKDTGVAEESSLEDAPLVQQISDRVGILTNSTSPVT